MNFALIMSVMLAGVPLDKSVPVNIVVQRDAVCQAYSAGPVAKSPIVSARMLAKKLRSEGYVVNSGPAGAGQPVYITGC